LFAQQPVGPHAAGHHQALQARLLARAASVFFTSTSTMAACVLAARSALRASQLVPQLRLACVSTAVFRPAKEKSRSPLCSKGRGSLKAVALPCSASATKRRPAGVAQAQQLGRFVKGLARRIVNGLAQQFVAAHAIDAHQLRVAARHQQRDEGEIRADRRSRKGDSKCPSRWCTPSTGLPSAAPRAQATPAPTSSAPAKPGPRV
jgi:hypothetical protein